MKKKTQRVTASTLSVIAIFLDYAGSSPGTLERAFTIV
jgi:hypothetical protein